MNLGGMIEVTAAYSNALLVAILPQVSDFAAKLNLEVRVPITTNDVELFRPYRHDIGGALALTNGMVFSYGHGHVDTYSREGGEHGVPRNRAWMDSHTLLTRSQAIQVVRDAIAALGHDGEVLYTDLEPKTAVEPHKVYSLFYNLYHFDWLRPHEKGFRSASAIVNAEQGRIEHLFLCSLALDRPPPPLAVQPQIQPEPRPWHYIQEPELSGLRQKTRIGADDLAGRLRLPIRLPIEAGDVQSFTAWTYGSLPEGVLVLTNGYGFSLRGDRVDHFWAPDVFFGAREMRAKEFFGRWQLNRRQATKLARDAIQRLGYPKSILDCSFGPEIQEPQLVGPRLIPRYAIHWRRKLRAGDWSTVSVEVDADRGRVTSLSFRSSKLQPELRRRPSSLELAP